jgi:hypothetical protein
VVKEIEGYRSIHGAGIDISIIERCRYFLGCGALATGRVSVDSNNYLFHNVVSVGAKIRAFPKNGNPLFLTVFDRTRNLSVFGDFSMTLILGASLRLATAHAHCPHAQQ